MCPIFEFLYTSRECAPRSLLYKWTSPFFCTSPYTSQFPDSQSKACYQISHAITLSSRTHTQLLISLIFSILTINFKHFQYRRPTLNFKKTALNFRSHTGEWTGTPSTCEKSTQVWRHKNPTIRRKSLEYSVSIFPYRCGTNFTGLSVLTAWLVTWTRTTGQPTNPSTLEKKTVKVVKILFTCT